MSRDLSDLKAHLEKDGARWVTGIASAGAVMARDTGSEPDGVVLMTLATAVAALAEEAEAGRG